MPAARALRNPIESKSFHRSDGVDGGHQARGGAAAAVADHVGVRCDAGDVERRRVGALGGGRGDVVDDVAARRGGGVRAVPVLVQRAPVVGGQEPVGADQLAVARELGVVLVGVRRVARAEVVAGAERVGVRVAVVAGLGEGGAARVDTGVDGADDDTLTLVVLRQAQLLDGVPQRVRVAPDRARVRVQLVLLVERDVRDGGVLGHLRGLGRRQHGGQAVDGELIGERHLDVVPHGAFHAGDEVVLLRLEELGVLPHAGGGRVERAAGPGRGGVQPGDVAGVGGHRGVGEPDQVGALRLAAAERQLLQGGRALDAGLRRGLGRYEVLGEQVAGVDLVRGWWRLRYRDGCRRDRCR